MSIKEPINRRIVFIGDDDIGKTTLISAFKESNPSKKNSSHTSLDVIFDSVPAIGAPAESNGTSLSLSYTKLNDKNDKNKKEDSESSDSDDSDREDPKLSTEIDAKFVYAGLKNNDKYYELAIWDTPSEKDFDKTRKFVYSRADIIILMFAIDSPKSLKNCSKKWRTHLKKNLKMNKKCPVILVGNKLDLRIKPVEDEESAEDEEEESIRQSVTIKYGQKVAKKLGAVDFFECSAVNKQGIYEIFLKAATYTKSEEASSTKCSIS